MPPGILAQRPSDLAQQTTLMISNKKIDDVVKIVKYLEESGLLVEGGSKTIKNQGREQKAIFLSMLLGTSSAALLGNLLKCERVKAKIVGLEVIRAGERMIRAGQNF